VPTERVFQLVLAEETRPYPALDTHQPSTADELGERISAHVERYIERQFESALTGDASTRKLAGLTAVGLATPIGVVGVLIAIGVAVKLAFF
jgi:hypothetical protein